MWLIAFFCNKGEKMAWEHFNSLERSLNWHTGLVNFDKVSQHHFASCNFKLHYLFLLSFLFALFPPFQYIRGLCCISNSSFGAARWVFWQSCKASCPSISPARAFQKTTKTFSHRINKHDSDLPFFL